MGHTQNTSLTTFVIGQVFAQQYPRYLLRIVNKHEEFYALLMLFVERHYLKTYGNHRFASYRTGHSVTSPLCRSVVCREFLRAEAQAKAPD